MRSRVTPSIPGVFTHLENLAQKRGDALGLKLPGAKDVNLDLIQLNAEPL